MVMIIIFAIIMIIPAIMKSASMIGYWDDVGQASRTTNRDGG